MGGRLWYVSCLDVCSAVAVEAVRPALTRTDRPKRRRSPSPFGPPSHRARLHSPSPPPPRRHPAHELPDPASLEHLLTYRQFSEWFRASHPQTAKADEEELRRAQQEEDGGAGKGRGKVGMPKRFERYRREYSSRQVSPRAALGQGWAGSGRAVTELIGPVVCAVSVASLVALVPRTVFGHRRKCRAAPQACEARPGPDGRDLPGQTEGRRVRLGVV